MPIFFVVCIVTNQYFDVKSCAIQLQRGILIIGIVKNLQNLQIPRRFFTCYQTWRSRHISYISIYKELRSSYLICWVWPVDLVPILIWESSSIFLHHRARRLNLRFLCCLHMASFPHSFFHVHLIELKLRPGHKRFILRHIQD